MPSPRHAAVLTCLLVPLAFAAEPEGRSIPYQKLYEPLAAIQKADPDHIVTSSLRAEPAEPGQALPEGLKIELRHGSARDPVAVDADGRFALPMHPDWAATDATLWLNQPKSAVKVVEEFKMRAPAGLRLSYGQLMESLPVMERIQQQHVGIGGMLAGAPTGVELAYAPGTVQTVTVGAGAAAKSWNTDENGIVKVPFDPALPKTTPVVLTAPPNALQPYAP